MEGKRAKRGRPAKVKKEKKEKKEDKPVKYIATSKYLYDDYHSIFILSGDPEPVMFSDKCELEKWFKKNGPSRRDIRVFRIEEELKVRTTHELVL